MRRWLANLLLLFVTLLVGLVGIELGLRLLPNSWELERRASANPGKQFVYQRQSSAVYHLSPNQSGEKTGPCYRVAPVSVDAAGFRTTIGDDADAEIAFLGDSFAEALHVPDGLTIADHLSRYTGRRVLNVGVSGYATSHEILAWRQRVKAYRPKLVVLLLYLGNDISGNSCALSKTELPCAVFRDGNLVLLDAAEGVATGDLQARETNKPSPPFLDRQFAPRLRLWLRENVALYGLAHDLKIMTIGAVSSLMGHVDARWGLYERSPDSTWAEAWLATEELLATLRREVEAQGATLVVAVIPEALALSNDPKAAVRFGTGSALPRDFDADAPSEKAMDIVARLGIPSVDLLPVFRTYQKRFQLPSPGFSFACDGHWNPLGHRLASEAIAERLVGLGLLSRPIESRERAQDTRPEKLLGEIAFAQIYGGGVYNPRTAAE